MLTEPGPSAVTADLTEDRPLTQGEIRERMSGNLCRCGAYVNIVGAIAAEVPQDRDGGRGMKPFTYIRAGSPAEAVREFGDGAAYLGGGTNLVDLMRLGVSAPSTPHRRRPVPSATRSRRGTAVA